MQGLMMDRPLLLSGLLEHAARVHGDRELVSCIIDEPIHRGSYRGLALRARQVAVRGRGRVRLRVDARRRV